MKELLESGVLMGVEVVELDAMRGRKAAQKEAKPKTGPSLG
jgi:hypothetical protein